MWVFYVTLKANRNIATPDLPTPVVSREAADSSGQ